MDAPSQFTLFDADPAGMTFAAIFGGPDDCYRYELRRIWDVDKPMLAVCMLNPSTADHQKNDPTILALIHFAKLWDYGGLLIVNLFALRTPSPTVMMRADAPVGPENGVYLDHALRYAWENGGRMLAAWGNDGDFYGRSDWFCGRAQIANVALICLGKTKTSMPKHPMARGLHRIPRDQQPIVYRANIASNDFACL